ncbi:hypothetical protein LCGC14_0946720 [marine sediment metagenome]|uniref:Recombination endonuclease VII n=1 Tax=marine sediment metagenome TaxID=412755 RepID=A0A0F9P4L5_9ZZZZ
MEPTKQCKVCGGNLILSLFKPDRRSTDNHASICTSCLDDRERRIETPAVYEQMFIKQGQGCAICKRPVFISQILIDHDPQTDETRGLLCRNCNRLLRFAGRDVKVLTAAAEYLGPNPLVCHSTPKNGCSEIYARLESFRSTSPPAPITK